jgi:hypothetical protein
MRPSFRFPISLVLFVLMTSAGPPASSFAEEPKNLLKNPGAERAKGDRVDAWGAIAVPRDANASLSRTTKEAHSGKASLLGDVKGGDGFVQWVQNVEEFPRGSNLRLSGFIKSKGKVQAHMMFQAFDDANKLIAVGGSEPMIEGTRDWTKVRTQVTDIPSGAKMVIVRLVVSGKGQAWFDDLTLAVDGDGETAEADRDSR